MTKNAINQKKFIFSKGHEENQIVPLVLTSPKSPWPVPYDSGLVYRIDNKSIDNRYCDLHRYFIYQISSYIYKPMNNVVFRKVFQATVMIDITSKVRSTKKQIIFNCVLTRRRIRIDKISTMVIGLYIMYNIVEYMIVGVTFRLQIWPRYTVTRANCRHINSTKITQDIQTIMVDMIKFNMLNIIISGWNGDIIMVPIIRSIWGASNSRYNNF